MPNSEQRFQIEANSCNLPPFREKLRALLHQSGLNDKALGEVVLAVDEALTNAIRHSYEGKEGKIEFLYADFPDRIQITIEDVGKKFDPSTLPAPELPPQKAGGLGVYLIKQLMDKVEYDKDFKGNRHILTKYKRS